jgi:hypothetical protein
MKYGMLYGERHGTCNESAPLLHGDGFIVRQAKPIPFHLGVEAIQVQMRDYTLTNTNFDTVSRP